MCTSLVASAAQRAFATLEFFCELRPFVGLRDWSAVSECNKTMYTFRGHIADRCLVDVRVRIADELPVVVTRHALQHLWQLWNHAKREQALYASTVFTCRPRAVEDDRLGTLSEDRLPHPHVWLASNKIWLLNKPPPTDAYVRDHGRLHSWYKQPFAKNVRSAQSGLPLRMDSIPWEVLTTDHINIPHRVVGRTRAIRVYEPTLLIAQNPRAIVICTRKEVKHCSATLEYMHALEPLVAFLKRQLESFHLHQAMVIVFGDAREDTINPHVVCEANNPIGLKRVHFNQTALMKFANLMLQLMTQRQKVLRAADICSAVARSISTDALADDSRAQRFCAHAQVLDSHSAYLREITARSIFV